MDAPANDVSGTNLSLTITIDVNQLLTQQLPSLNGFITGELPFNCIKSSEAAKLLPSHNIIEDIGPNQDYFYPVSCLPFLEPFDFRSDDYLTHLGRVKEVFEAEDFDQWQLIPMSGDGNCCIYCMFTILTDLNQVNCPGFPP